MTDKNWQSWIWIKWKAGAPTNAWESWKGNPTIANAWSTLGEWDCVLIANLGDPDKLEEFVWKHLRTNQWVEATSTTFAKKWW